MAFQFDHEYGPILNQDRAELEALRVALETGDYKIIYAANPKNSPTVDIWTPGGYTLRITEYDDVAWTHFTAGSVTYAFPEKVRRFLDQMHGLEYFSPELREQMDRRDWMLREAEADPEGAFGGRGNNFPIN